MVVTAYYVGKLIKSKLSEKDISQTELSKKLGYANQHGQFISNIIRGKCQLPPWAIKQLSDEFNLSVDEIIDLMVDDYRRCLKIEVEKQFILKDE